MTFKRTGPGKGKIEYEVEEVPESGCAEWAIAIILILIVIMSICSNYI